MKLLIINPPLSKKVKKFQEIHQTTKSSLLHKDDYLSLGKEYIRNKLYKLDGNATERTSSIIRGVVEQ